MWVCGVSASNSAHSPGIQSLKDELCAKYNNDHQNNFHLVSGYCLAEQKAMRQTGFE